MTTSDIRQDSQDSYLQIGDLGNLGAGTTIPRPTETDAWLAARRVFFNASAAATLFDEHPFTTLTDVVRSKLTPADEPFSNDAMRRGTHLEPAIANWWSDEHGIAVYEPDVLYVRGEWMATLDRRIVGNETDAVEIKTTARYVSRPEPHWVWQCQAQMYCADLERVHLVVLDASMRLQTFVIERDEQAIAELVERAHQVMCYLAVDQWPPSVPKSTEVLRHTDRVVELTLSAAETFTAWLAVREQLHELEQLETAHKAALVELLGDAQAATIEGVPVLTFRSHSRSSIDLDRLRKEHADLAAELSTEQVVRVLRPVQSKEQPMTTTTEPTTALDDETEAQWDAYWTWRTEHPDEYEQLLAERDQWC